MWTTSSSVWPGRIRLAAAAAIALVVAGCGEREAPAPEVVVFTALDRVLSEPILNDFERQTGIRVRPVYDAEAAKTTGLVNRLIARRDDPECDVFWNNEWLQTGSLAQMGMLEPYASRNAGRFPARWRDPEDRWCGFAGRVRLIIYNTERFADRPPPQALADFTRAEYHGDAAVALPYFGTTFTHVCILAQQRGPDGLLRWLTDMKRNGVRFAPGNGAVRDLVAAGEASFGLTDTDDAYAAMQDGRPVAVAIPDADEGAILIPNTVAIIRGAPNPEAARKLVDYLLSREVERKLAEARGAQIPLGTDAQDIPTPWDDLLDGVAWRAYDVAAAAAQREQIIELIRQAELERR